MFLQICIFIGTETPLLSTLQHHFLFGFIIRWDRVYLSFFLSSSVLSLWGSAHFKVVKAQGLLSFTKSDKTFYFCYLTCSYFPLFIYKGRGQKWKIFFYGWIVASHQCSSTLVHTWIIWFLLCHIEKLWWTTIPLLLFMNSCELSTKYNIWL